MADKKMPSSARYYAGRLSVNTHIGNSNMATKKHHWFPLYHDAWIVGTRHMNYAEQGIYLNLLLLQFERGDLSMDVIDRYLPRAGDWENEIQEILHDKFTKLPNGTFRNERMATVTQEQQSKSEKRSRQTAAARASKQKKVKAVTDTVTESVTGRELELELETELEKEKDLELKLDDSCANALRLKKVSLPAVASKDGIEVAITRWNKVASVRPGIAAVRIATEKRRKKWNASVKKPGFLEAWRAALLKLPVANTQTFTWQPTFDWMLSLDNVTKLVEGNYDQANQEAARNSRVARFINE